MRWRAGFTLEVQRMGFTEDDAKRRLSRGADPLVYGYVRKKKLIKRKKRKTNYKREK